MKFISIGSGSSGNCYYVGNGQEGFLIDAGVPVRTVKKSLRDVGVAMEQIQGILITHDHTDHIKYAGCFAANGIPVFATEKVHQGINHCHGTVQPIMPLSRRVIEKEQTFSLADCHITPFSVPHDGTDNVGYCIEAGSLTITLATDVGYITDTIAGYLRKASYIIIEANYDEEMLRMGHYPSYLKKRIASKYGHLSNHETAQFLAENFDGQWRHVWLCHLSKDNNHPELASKTVELALMNAGIQVGKDIELTALKRSVPSPLYEIL